ncbi:MAG: hypothetical protein HYR91_11100 [Flavobacteriia bacterium]|nr:hypothetical protein [Flavobacteriia bacterium]
MNKLITTANGGFDTFLNDIRFWDEAIRDSFKGLTSPFFQNSYDVRILSGCVRTISGSIVTISQGYVIYGGEICFVPSHSYTLTTGYFELWDLESYFDPAGSKIFKDLTSHETYQIRIAKVFPSAGLTDGNQEYSVTERYFDSFQNFLSIIDPEFPSFGTYNLAVMKDLNGFVHIKGKMRTTDIGVGMVNHTLGTLPMKYRPSVELERSVSWLFNSSTGEVRTSLVKIKTNGQLVLVAHNGNYSDVLDYGQITPFQV